MINLARIAEQPAQIQGPKSVTSVTIAVRNRWKQYSVQRRFFDFALCCDLKPMKTNLKEHDINVLVAYEDFAAGCRAMALLKRVGSQCGGPGRLIHMMWRFDVLSDPCYLELAVSEALAADIIIIAMREGRGLPQKVRNWIARWLLMKEDRPLALAASLDHDREKTSDQVCVLPYLAKLAHYGKMQFFSNRCAQATGVDLGGAKVNATLQSETSSNEGFILGL